MPGSLLFTFVLGLEFARQGTTLAIIDADPNAVIADWAARRVKAGLHVPFLCTASRTGRRNSYVSCLRPTEPGPRAALPSAFSLADQGLGLPVAMERKVELSLG
jgi:hypothetical protein